MDYSAVKLSASDIQKHRYKKHLGGGEKHWETRGAFQLYFLQKMGLQPSDQLLDAGCGPLRSGVHFINYLDSHNYCGIDSNPDFIRVAGEVVQKDPLLRDKSPRLECVDNFEVARLGGTFAYVLAFSVLNHCPEPVRRCFFENISGVVAPESKIFITHAPWFEDGLLSNTRLQLKRTLGSAAEIAGDLDMQTWGWQPKESIFPILELALRE